MRLLLLVLCAAALVAGCGTNLTPAQARAKALEDLDTLRNALTLHNSQNRELRGTSFAPLLGRYMQELPSDPWGRPYLLDADAGVIGTLGADGAPAGTGADADILVAFKIRLKLQRASLTRGAPAPALSLEFTKPVRLTGDPVKEVTVTGTPLDAGGAKWSARVQEGNDARSASTVVLTCGKPGDPASAAKLEVGATVLVHSGKVEERLADGSFLASPGLRDPDPPAEQSAVPIDAGR